MSRSERILGCLLGGAVGDALGAPVDFWSSEEIERHTPMGVRDYLPSSYGPTLGLVTDDTQMMLFTLEGLLGCYAKSTETALARIHRSYMQWYGTQVRTESTIPAAQGLAGESWLYSRRAPGITCMSALAQTALSLRLGSPAANDSNGSGAVMRSSPFGFVPDIDGAEFALQAAQLTHGGTEARVSAGALAHVISELMTGVDLHEATESAIAWTRSVSGGQETASTMERAVSLARRSYVPSREDIESLGSGNRGDEALAMALYCGLAVRGADRFLDSLSLAVSHGGDSDTVGAVGGNILGAQFGSDALPIRLASKVEGRPTIERLSALASDVWSST